MQLFNILKILILYTILSLSAIHCSDKSCPIKLEDEPSNIKITSPINGAAFTFGDDITINTKISDLAVDSVYVEFYINDIMKRVDDTSPFEYELSNLAYRLGRITIEAVVTDNKNNKSSHKITISINSNSTPIYNISVQNTYPHDKDAFTQGLFFDTGYLYESTGRYGQSSLRKVELETGNVVKIHNVSNQYFCEGITLWNDHIYQLTWQAQTGFIYQKDDFAQTGSFTYTMNEGWGLTNNESKFILSDGSSTIYYLNPDNYSIYSKLNITEKGNPVTNINELEYIDGDLFANIWNSNRIARISLSTGNVIGWIDLKDICNVQPYGVLNGIAYDDIQNRLFITGKRWDKIYEIVIIPKSAS